MNVDARGGNGRGRGWDGMGGRGRSGRKEGGDGRWEYVYRYSEVRREGNGMEKRKNGKT